MFLGNTLSSATSGLDAIERQIALLSQNVANAQTPNYVRQTLPLTSLATEGGPAGVRAGVATRVSDDHLQGDLFASVATESESKTTQTALEGIDQISGTPGSGQDLSSLFGALRDSFSTLANDPSSGSQQLDVISKAEAFTDGLHTVGNAIVDARQVAQNALASDVKTVNTSLRAVGALSDQIIAAKATGQSTADLENQRDGQEQTLAQLIGAKFVPQSNGDVQVIAGNSVVPTRPDKDPYTIGNANINGASPPATIPPLQLDGITVNSLGGQVGANLKLRDTTLPALQGQLDGFAQSVASAFSTQNLPLFTDPSGTVPPTGTTGFALTIQVSATVQGNPLEVRDGAGPPTGDAGDTTVIQNVLSHVFASDSTGLPEQATSLIAGFAQAASQAKATADTNTAVRTGLQSRLTAVTGVSVDTELAQMVQLQTAYAANAKVVTAVQNMWTALLGTLP